MHIDPVTPIATFADLIHTISRDPSLKPSRRYRNTYRLRRLCKIIGAAPCDVPASLDAIRDRVNGLYPELIGVSRQEMHSIRSNAHAMFRQYGLTRMPNALRSTLSPEWARLSRLLDRRARSNLSRFFHYCSEHRFLPSDVSDSTLADFHEALRTGVLTADPRGLCVAVVRHWNRQAGTSATWPKVKLGPVPRTKQLQHLDWTMLPPDLRRDIDAYIQWLEGAHIDGVRKDKPFSVRTLSTRRAQLRVAASLMIQAGVAKNTLTRVDDLVRPENVRVAFERLHQVNGQRITVYLKNLAYLLRLVARSWTKADQEAMTRLDGVLSVVLGAPASRRPIARERLRSVECENRLRLLFDAPGRMLAFAIDNRSHSSSAVVAQIGMSIGLLLYAPIRTMQLLALRLTDDFETLEDGSMLVKPVAAPEQPRRDVSYFLPSGIAGLVRRYVEHYRPRLTDDANVWLYPGHRGEPKKAAVFDRQFGREITRFVGLRLSPRDIRILAAKLHLEARPGDPESVRRLLGLRRVESIDRTYRKYVRSTAPHALDTLIIGKANALG